MKTENIKTPEDILEFMKSNIKYGWLDVNNKEHIGNMKSFRKLYRTSSLEEILEHKIGTCIEQVYLMKTLLDEINISNKMFCSRIYEGDDFNDLDADEHMHCFVLYYLNDKVYQIEHPNWERIGIYEFNSEEEAVNKINEYYIKKTGGHARPITQFYEVEPNISFKQFNSYINSLDNKIIGGYNMNLKDLRCVNKYINIDEYIKYRELVKQNMLHPDWLGDFSKEDLVYMLKNNSVIWIYYLGDDFVCSMMLIPSTEKDLKKFEIDLDYNDVVDYGPMFVNPRYVGNGLQYQMLKELDNYSVELGYEYAAGTIHPDNIYSINNLIKDGFELVGTKEFKRGTRNIYLKKLSR